MITREIELALAQEDGNLPTTIVAGSAPGESGVSIRFVRFRDGLHLSGTVQQHFICFQLAQACFDCRIGGRSLRHEPPAGSLASVLRASTAQPMPRAASMPFSSLSIRAISH
jgi:hypothetical protein